MFSRQTDRLLNLGSGMLVGAVALSLWVPRAWARPNIREAFFAVYPDAVGTPIETVPSFPNHCGVCHFDFGGGGPRNPYGVRLGNELPNWPNNQKEMAVLAIENEDPDGDGFSTLIEVTDTITFSNTPTFPGLTPANVGGVLQVDVTEIQGYLVPSTGGDTTPPDVTVIYPNGGQLLVANGSASVEWTATDASGIAAIDLYLSLDGGLTYRPIALGLSNTGSHTWFPANRPTTTALMRVLAIDNAFNHGQDESDAFFEIESPPGGLVPTTLRDFDQPGSQPFEAGILNPPEACAVCHGNYDTAVEPYYNWQGSMMSQASRDVLFMANMVIANQDAPDSGDLCLRCHLPRGWLQGRSVPTDGSQMLATDKSGVSCDFCHRLVDPIYDPQENPMEDQDILANLSFPTVDFGNGMATIDPTGARRGPFLNAATGHPVLVSPFHREAALCGTCHDVSNPAFQKDGQGNYVPNAFDAPAVDFSAHTLAPVERTYSEWFYSDYNSLEGVFAPQFGGNLDYVATCQDCHMRDVTGQGCNFGTPPIRDDLPLHDITGGSTWLPGLLSSLFPGEVNDAALQDGIQRARYMLQNAADMVVVQEQTQLVEVTITNNTGHKLPTGYPEGRRMWINVRFYDDTMTLISESAAYDPATGVLGHDAEAKIYEIEPGLDEVTAPIVGVDPGPSFHFVLNNKIFKDNRIPPRGFTNAAYADFGGAPVAYSYADGQYWDETYYAIPSGATSVQVTLYYQSTSKEFVEFLRDENITDTQGQELYDLWNNNGKCPPEIMQQVTISLAECFTDSDCDDGVKCTLDVCDTVAGLCSNDPIAGCCASDADCDDGNKCTLDVCDLATNICSNDPIPGCCAADVDCDDGVKCTLDVCDLATNTCSNDPIVGCCASDADCDDGVKCTADVCDLITNTCSNDPIVGCCASDADCDDGDKCTLDVCDVATNTCTNDPIPDCCASDADCDDGVKCTLDVCDVATNTCSNSPIPDCCAADADCDDGVKCTADICDLVTNTCANDPIAGCCASDADCDDGNKCTLDSCDLITNTCVFDPVPDCCAADADCDDGNKCTLDVCDLATNTCSNDPIPDCCASDADCDDGNKCTQDSCDLVTNTCVFDPIADCCANDGECDDGIPCTIDTCNLVTNQCEYVPDHAVCDDFLFCTGTESCDPDVGCVSSGDPCQTGEACNEDTDSCDFICPIAQPPALQQPIHYAKNRALTIVSPDPGRQVALRVTLRDLPPPRDTWNGTTMWLGQPRRVCENSGQGPSVPPQNCAPAAGLPSRTFWTASLTCSPQCWDFGAIGLIHVISREVVPDALYDVQAIDCQCAEFENEDYFSVPQTVDTSLWGDIMSNCTTIPCGPPNGTVDVLTDVVGILNKFSNLPGAPIKSRVDLEPYTPDLVINITDALEAVGAFQGFGFPYASGPTPCSP